MAHESIDSPSEWAVRWAPHVTRGPVLDIASGSGRHARFFAQRGLEVVAVDREPQRIVGVEFVQADLEKGAWPFTGQRFGAIIVTNYLHRPLFTFIEKALGEGGVLIYETFMAGNERFGRPSNPDFLLRPGELAQAFCSLQVLGFEEGEVQKPKPAVTQRICAVNVAKKG